MFHVCCVFCVFCVCVFFLVHGPAFLPQPFHEKTVAGIKKGASSRMTTRLKKTQDIDKKKRRDFREKLGVRVTQSLSKSSTYK